MLNNQTIVKPEYLRKFGTVKTLVQKELGAYKEACQAFAQKVSKLNGVIAIGALPYPGYVDIWTITNRRNRNLDRAIK